MQSSNLNTANPFRVLEEEKRFSKGRSSRNLEEIKLPENVFKKYLNNNIQETLINPKTELY